MKINLIKSVYLLIGALLLLSSCMNNPVEIIPKSIVTVNDIVLLDSSMVKPYDYLNVVSLNEFPVKEKKQKFIDMVLPAILVAKVNLEFTKNEVTNLISKDTSKISNKQKLYLGNLLKKYRANNFEELLLRLNTHPNSIVLAQSAIESGWGTSRFFLEANNIFGVWSFNKSDNRIKANSDREGKETFLKKYNSLSASIADYFVTIGRGPYKDFRLQREKTSNPYQLINNLKNYSELGEEYIEKLKIVIRSNNLIKFDNYQIDPKYLNKDLTVKQIETEVFEKIKSEFEKWSLQEDARKEEEMRNLQADTIVRLMEPAEISYEKTESNLPDFGSISNVEEKKKEFFNFMHPLLVEENNLVLQERNFVVEMQKKTKSKIEFTDNEISKLNELAVSYRVKDIESFDSLAFNKLLLHIDIIPAELALSQAALESAWGTSYFARKANNIFGQWCFTPGCGVVPKRRPDGETHEVAIFNDVSHSVRYYLSFLNSHPLFEKLRKTRFKNRKNNEEPNSYDMAGGLSAYSARGSDYISELRNMIRSNKKYMGIE